MRSEKMESFIFIPGNNSWQNNNGFTLPHMQSEHSFLNQLVVVIHAVSGERKRWLCNFPWLVSYEIPVVEMEVVEIGGADCPQGLGQLVSLLNHSLLVSPQVFRRKTSCL